MLRLQNPPGEVNGVKPVFFTLRTCIFDLIVAVMRPQDPTEYL